MIKTFQNLYYIYIVNLYYRFSKPIYYRYSKPILYIALCIYIYHTLHLVISLFRSLLGFGITVFHVAFALYVFVTIVVNE